MRTTSIVWFRRDLRLDDNPALKAAVEESDAVIPLFLRKSDPERKGQNSASDVWLHHALEAFSARLQKTGSDLVIRTGDPLKALEILLSETGAKHVYWNRLYEPQSVARDTRIKEALTGKGVEVSTYNGALLYEPWEVKNKQGKPYRVYTPFWRELERRGRPADPLSPVTEIPAPPKWPDSISIEALGLLPENHWHDGIVEAWQPGEQGARGQLSHFLEDEVEQYSEQRDIPGETGTSRLSPHLHFGEISPRTVFHSTLERANKVTPYLRQIVWREFAHHLLFHFPETVEENLNPAFNAFPWRESPEDLRAWQSGQTGYPIVDAGMRELWHTGWMHNRVRMIVGSFLVKDLLIHWREGASWFWDTLVDADLANNTMGWQWIAGCGADAAPYFRVFNPVTQGGKFDGKGDYVRRWVPELKNLPDKYLHKPWDAPQEVLDEADVVLGQDYPEPIVDHAGARIRALGAYDQIRRK